LRVGGGNKLNWEKGAGDVLRRKGNTKKVKGRV